MKTDELCSMATNEEVKTFLPHVVAGLRADQTGIIYFIGGKLLQRIARLTQEREV